MSPHSSITFFLCICTETLIYFLLGYLPKCASVPRSACVWGLIHPTPHAPTQSHKGPAMRIGERENWRGSCLFANVRLTLELRGSNTKHTRASMRVARAQAASQSLESHCAHVHSPRRRNGACVKSGACKIVHSQTHKICFVNIKLTHHTCQRKRTNTRAHAQSSGGGGSRARCFSLSGGLIFSYR